MRYTHHMRVGPVGFRIGSDWAQPIADIRRLYADYPGQAGGFAHATVRLEATRPWRRLIRPSVRISGDYMIPDALPLPLTQGLLAAEMGMNMQVALGWRQHLLLHASAVERDGRAIIMVGESGSGKSTLAALLGEQGWRLMGDEFTLIDVRSGPTQHMAFAMPRLVSLKNASIDEVAARVDARRLGPVISGTPKGTIRHLVPRADAVARMDDPAMPALLLFPTFGAPAQLRPVGRAEAFVRLTDSSTNYVALGEAGFRALGTLVKSVPAVAMGYGSSEDGLGAVEALWAELRA